jgi:polar amino acid transport system permease protein
MADQHRVRAVDTDPGPPFVPGTAHVVVAAGPQSKDDYQVVALRHPFKWLAILGATLLLVMLVHGLVTNSLFQWSLVWKYLFDGQILGGLERTLILTVLAMVVGVLLGTLLAIMRLANSRPLAVMAAAYIWFFRGTPVLVQLIFWYNFAALYSHVSLGVPFGPAFVSADVNNLIDPWTAAVLGLGLNQAAYTAEIIRGGILSVGRGQQEAGLAIGMHGVQVFWHITLPQAMKVVIPPIGNEVISMLKGTSLVSVIALTELLYTAQLIYSENYQTIPLLIVVSLWYLAATSVLSVGQHFVERRFSRDLRPDRWIAAEVTR